MRGRGDASNIMVNLQHDVGKWCTEYTWSAEDGMWGVRVLHNFGRLGAPADSSEDSEKSTSPTSGLPVGVKRVDEEDAVEGGLKGRLSVGAEFYFSAKERSAGGQSSSLMHPASC
jgi:distribution and morphology protein 10